MQTCYEQAVAKAAAYYQENSTEMTLAFGFNAQGEMNLALAAGLRDEAMAGRFKVLLQYLFNRDSVTTYVLMQPAWLNEQAVAVAEVCQGSELSRAICLHAEKGLQPAELATETDHILGDLWTVPKGLPAIMRRDLDRLYEQIRLP